MFSRSHSKIEHKNVGSFLAFNKEFFEKHQRKLLWLLNNRFTGNWFKRVMRIDKDDVGYSKEIEWILPHAYAVKGRKPGELIAEFRTHPKYGKRIYQTFKPLWWLMHFWDWILADKFIPKLSFGFSTLTAYPDANPETTTVDGEVRHVYTSGSGQNWSIIIAAAGSAVSDNTTTMAAIGITTDTVSNKWRILRRAIMLFDTSSIPDTDTINSAILSIYVTSKSDAISITPNINIYSSTPASNTGLVASDFANVGSTPFATAIGYSSIATGAYNDFTLNSNGLANISKTGVSKFSTRNENYEVSNVAPTWAGSNLTSDIQASQADETGTTQDPKLVVTYTAGVDVTVSATVLSAIFSLIAISLIAESRISPSVQSGLFSIPSLAVKSDQVLLPNVQSAAFSIPLVTFSNATNVTVSLNAQSSSFSMQSPVISASVVNLPNTQTATFTIPSLSLITNSILLIATQILTFSIQPLVRLGSFYIDKYQRQNTNYSDKYNKQDTSYSDLYTPRNF